HDLAFGDDIVLRKQLDVGGEYAYRIRGEKHAWSPDVVADLQHAVRTKDESPENAQGRYNQFASRVNSAENGYLAIRHLLDVKPIGEAVFIDEVEPASDIVKRFVTGAMSFGSISREVHTTLAIAMNKIGGKSNK